MHGSRKGFASQLSFEFEHGEKLLLSLFWQSGGGNGLIQRNGLAKAVEVRCAIGAFFEVPFELTTFCRGELGIELLADVAKDVLATHGLLLHAVM